MKNPRDYLADIDVNNVAAITASKVKRSALVLQDGGGSR